MRQNKVTAILGRRGTGKTTYMRELMQALLIGQNKKILILDTLDHPSYKDVPIIDTALLKRWQSPAMYRMFDKDTDKLLQNVECYFNNGLLVLEDASKYLRRTLSNEVRMFIFDSKQKNVDIIFLFHGFMAMPKELFSIVDNLVIFKTDDPKNRKGDIMNYQEVKEVYDRVMAHESPYYNETIQIY